MKGMITEFLEMVEEKFSMEMVDQILSESDLPSGGIYTSVGNYPHTEIVSLVINLSKESQIPLPDLLYAFGERLFERFAVRYQHFLSGTNSALNFWNGWRATSMLKSKSSIPKPSCRHLKPNDSRVARCA